MTSAEQRVVAGISALALAVVCTPAVEAGATPVAFAVFVAATALAACVIAFLGLTRHRSSSRRGWRLIVLASTLWAVGTLLWNLDHATTVTRTGSMAANVIFATWYPLMAIGLLILGRHHAGPDDRPVMIDAGITTVSVILVAMTTRGASYVGDGSVDQGARIVSLLTTIADTMLLVLAIRFRLQYSRVAPAARLLLVSVVASFVTNLWWTTSNPVTADPGVSSLVDAIRLSGFVFLAGAVWIRPHPPGSHEVIPDQRRRLVSRAVGLLPALVVPSAVILVEGATRGSITWKVVGPAMALLSALVIARLVGLLTVVNKQRATINDLAVVDQLTGLTTRTELEREVKRWGRENAGATASIALLDFDNFTRFTEENGWQAGDDLLREAADRWSAHVGASGTLARWAGEEFALLLPGLTVEQAARRIEELADMTPSGQTFSAGVAPLDTTAEMAVAVAAADQALYRAKRGGRDRVITTRGATAPDLGPLPRIALQPIVDVVSGKVVAMEALARFTGESPLTAFARAHDSGIGDELEVAAVTVALQHLSPHYRLAVNMSLATMFTAVAQEALPDDLSGIIIEVTERDELPVTKAQLALLADMRRRGVWIAIDDWGAGYSNLARILRLEPDIIKLDGSITADIESTYHRAIVRSMTRYGVETGARICAEGVETERQRQVIAELGVPLAQGYLLGRPTIPEAPQRSGETARVTTS